MVRLSTELEKLLAGVSSLRRFEESSSDVPAIGYQLVDIRKFTLSR